MGGNPDFVGCRVMNSDLTANEAGLVARNIFDYIESGGRYSHEFRAALLDNQFPFIVSDHPVASKTGWTSPRAWHDMAIVYAPSPFTLVILSARYGWTDADYADFKEISTAFQEFNDKWLTTSTNWEHDMVVWLDAGHGGKDGGTSAMYDGHMRLEKDIVLDIVLMVYEMFASSTSGIQAFLTRAQDEFIPAAERPNLWNGVADLVVSVHVDYYEGPTAHQVSGIQVNFYENDHVSTGRFDIPNAQLAQVLQDHLIDMTGARDRHIRGNRNFAILEGSTVPTALIEAGFMSHPEELSLLVSKEYQKLLATAIYNAIIRAFELYDKQFTNSTTPASQTSLHTPRQGS